MNEISDSRSSSPSTPPRSLNAIQRRVLGVLIEKSKTTPGGYPMTVNAIVTGCNQKSNRAPLTEFDLGYDWLSVDRVEIAVLGELLLRGAQALGELRGRASRMQSIADLAELKPIVDRLVQRNLMVELTSPGRGQIVSHNLYPHEELQEIREQVSRSGSANAAVAARERVESSPARRTDVANPEIAQLRAAVEDLRRRVQELEERLDSP
jgi:uncharacterized protein YceH (UPF0502 family)